MSEFDDEDVQPTPAQNAHKRALDLVIRDHAREAWGQLRDIDHLDSEKAERTLVGVMQNLLHKSGKVKAPSVKRN